MFTQKIDALVEIDESNIVSFQRRFQLVPGARDDDEFMLRSVFGAERPKEIGALPQETRLQHAIVSPARGQTLAPAHRLV